MDHLLDLDVTTQYAAGGIALLTLIAFLLLQPTGFVKWLQKKNYQYEVTFALYMLTPTEKFIFNSVLFLTVSMLTTACVIYLPNHVATMSRRAYYYVAGDAALLPDTVAVTTGLLKEVVAGKTSEGALRDATALAGAAYQAAVHTAVESLESK